MSLSTRKVDTKGRVVLPEQFIGKTVAIERVGEEEVRIRIVRTPRRCPPLSWLLAGATEENLANGAVFGPPQGEEQF
jgi:hypothetical protein